MGNNSKVYKINQHKLRVIAFCVLLCLSNFSPAVLGAKLGKSSKSRSKSSSSSVSSGRVTKTNASPSYSNPGSLSYNNYQSKPAPSAPVGNPSSAAGATNQRPIGWNVNNNQPAKPYPVQPGHNPHQTHAAPPPPYSVNNQHGPPPPYSAANNPNLNSHFNQPPPAYSPGNQGFRPGGYQQPGYGGGFGGGYHPQPGATGGFGGLPHGGLQGGGIAPPVNYAPAPSFPISAIPVGAYQKPSSGIGIGGVAAGVGTGLLAGAAGAAIYNALRPEDRGIYRDRVIVINNSEKGADNSAAAAAAPAAPAAPAGNVAVPQPEGTQAVAGAPNTPIIMNTNATTDGQAESSSMTPLASYNETAQPAVVPTGKQYYPPPGQYYPATGQYVPPGEFDPATNIFTPGRYIPDTNIFQPGQYDPLTQIFTPGSYDPATGQFLPDPNNGPINLAVEISQAATESSQPLNQAPQSPTIGGAAKIGTSLTLPAVIILVARILLASHIHF